MNIDKTVALHSPYYLGYLILRVLKEKKFHTIYSLYDDLKKDYKITSRQLMMGMIFLFSLGLIEFSEARVWLIK